MTAATPPCPTCGGNGVPIMFGLPAPSAREAAADGELILGGCFELENAPQWACLEAHQWITQEAQWLAAIEEVVRGRPHCRACGGETRYLLYSGVEELFEEELASGEAEMATTDGPPGTNWNRICRACRAVS